MSSEGEATTPTPEPSIAGLSPHASNGRRMVLAVVVSAILPASAMARQDLEDVHLEPVAQGFSAPVYLTHAGDDRLFVVERAGRIEVVEAGTVRTTPFLDITARVLGGGEQGLLSVAFHPDYAQNGWLFVDYTRKPDGATVVSRFRRNASNPNLADAGSEAVLLVVAQPFANHNGGQLQFGPDGMLWVGMGDGGSGNDPLCHAQRRDSLLGKLLRLDVDTNSDAPPYHSVPADNPFVGAGDFADEVWGFGLRNPWRFSFDRLTGDLYVGDVGQNEIEEIDFEPAGDPGGRNYGWRMMEGSACANDTDGCPAFVPPCGDPSLVPPVLEYLHSGANCSVTGGYVYRGSAVPELLGRYLYGDFCSGRLFAARRQGGTWTTVELEPRLGSLSSFGEDADGELYLLSLDGSVSRFAGSGPAPGEEPFVCVEEATTLCLAQERFRVRATWRSNAGSGTAVARPLTADTGAFWFFEEANLELVVKTLEACAVNDRVWVFATGLTDVEVVIEVADSATGERREYRSTLGQAFRPVTDTDAFAVCP